MPNKQIHQFLLIECGPEDQSYFLSRFPSKISCTSIAGRLSQYQKPACLAEMKRKIKHGAQKRGVLHRAMKN